MEENLDNKKLDGTELHQVDVAWKPQKLQAIHFYSLNRDQKLVLKVTFATQYK